MKYIRPLSDQFKNNHIIFFTYIIVIPIVLYIQLSEFVKLVAIPNEIKLCFADYFILTKSNIIFYYLIMPLNIIFWTNNIKNDFRINNVIRYNDSSELWKKQSLQCLINAMFLTIYIQFISFIIGITNFTDIINFGQKKSIFALSNYGVTNKNVTIIQVLIITTLFYIVLIFIIDILFILLRWHLKRTVYPIIILFSLMILDFYGIGVFKYAGVDYENWIPYNIVPLIVVLILSVILYLLGIYFSKNKEWLNEK